MTSKKIKKETPAQAEAKLLANELKETAALLKDAGRKTFIEPDAVLKKNKIKRDMRGVWKISLEKREKLLRETPGTRLYHSDTKGN